MPLGNVARIGWRGGFFLSAAESFLKIELVKVR
jgi:hypothetical protein